MKMCQYMCCMENHENQIVLWKCMEKNVEKLYHSQ
jgi:hypothetical protein